MGDVCYSSFVRIVGVIPAAGYATRLQPLDGSKEVYPIDGRPVMDYLVERMRAAGCSELRVVTRPEKRDVIENAARHGAVVVEAHPQSLAESYFAGLSGLGDDDVVLLGFPDAIWEPVDGYRRLLEFRNGRWDVALGLLRAPDLTRHETVVFDDSGRVRHIEFKVQRPSSDWMWGLAIASARFLRPLEREREPGIYFDRLARDGRVGALTLPGTFLDIGTPQGLEEALSAVGG